MLEFGIHLRVVDFDTDSLGKASSMLSTNFFLLLVVLNVASAIQPRQDSGLIQEQQLLEQQQQEQWQVQELGSHRRAGLSADQEMSCPAKPEGAPAAAKTLSG